MIRGINHVTLAVADLARSVAFYRDVLGCRVAHRWERGAYLEAGTLWLCLSVDDRAGGQERDYTHLAFDVAPEHFAALANQIRKSGAKVWKTNRSEGESLYFCCPDGHQLELHVGDLHSRLHAIQEQARSSTPAPPFKSEPYHSPQNQQGCQSNQ